MTKKDVFSLAYHNTKKDKVLNRNIRIGFSGSFFCLFIIFYLLLSFFAGIHQITSAYSNVSSFQIVSTNEENLNFVTQTIKDDEIVDTLSYQKMNRAFPSRGGFSNHEILYPIVSLDGKEIEYHFGGSLTIEGYSDAFFLPSEVDALKKNNNEDCLLLGKIPEKGGKELLVSKAFALNLFPSLERAVGQTFSFSFRMFSDNPSDTKFQSFTVFNNRKISGIYNPDLYLCDSRGSDEAMVCDILCYQNDIFRRKDQEISYYQVIQFSSFSAAYQNSKTAFLIRRQLIEQDKGYLECVCGKTLRNYRENHSRLVFLSILFSTIGVVILFVSSIGFYITIEYQNKKQQNYGGMLKAIGMKNKEMLLMSFFENLIHLLKSYFISLILALPICIGGTILYNQKILLVTSSSFYSIHRIWLIPVVVFFFLLILLLAFIGSSFLSSQNSKVTIASLLKTTRNE